MAAFDGEREPEGYPCNTCQALFSSVDKVKSHYKGDWHIFNSKRRAHNLVPVSKADFKAIGPTVKKAPAAASKAKAVAASAAASSDGGDSVETPQHPSAVKRAGGGGDAKVAAAQQVVPLNWGGITANTAEEMVEIAKGMGIGEKRMDSIVQMAMSRREEEIRAEKEYRARKRAAFLKANPDAAAEEEEEESAMKEDAGDGDDSDESVAEEQLPQTGPNVSIFDNKVFDTTEENVKYMRDTFGFFVPDQEILEDLDGLVEYLNEKVKLGGFCLYCQRHFEPGRSCQQHMIAKSHCKIAYAEGVDLDEFEDFYDYEKANEGLPMDEDGNPISAQATLDPVTSELILPNGKKLGHRMYATYYKQPVSTEDQRPSVVAAKREELLKLGVSLGHNYTESDIVAMPDTQVMNLVVKYHKARRKEVTLQQRAKQKDEMRAKRSDYQIKVSKLRSSEQRTQIIRDYHGGLQ